MRTSAQAAAEFVDNSTVVCSLFDALIDYERYVGTPYQPDAGSLRPTSDELIAELRAAFRHYGEELLAEVEGKVGEVRTELKYQPEDSI